MNNDYYLYFLKIYIYYLIMIQINLYQILKNSKFIKFSDWWWIILYNCLLRNSEDRLILQLYTTLEREAKELVLEEESKEKLLKKDYYFIN